jgi:hypothetical protein
MRERCAKEVDQWPHGRDDSARVRVLPLREPVNVGARTIRGGAYEEPSDG